jgi:hypothetical protein
VDGLTVHRTSQLTAGRVAVLILALGACSEEDPDEPKVEPTTSSSVSPTDATTPSESTEPTVALATGPVLDTGSATINLPEGWKDNQNGLPFTYSGSPQKGAAIRLITIVDLDSISTGFSIAKQARIALTKFPGAKLTVQPDVELDGSPAYHVAGTVPVRGPFEEVGTDSHGRSLNITFSLNGYTAAERREIVDPVIASFRWKD